MKILLVEDEFTSRAILTRYAECYGTVETATSGEQAMQALAASVKSGNHYSLLLLDLYLPNKQGAEVLRETREMERTCGMPATVIVVITSLESESARLAATKLADGYLVKPINEQTVREELARHGILPTRTL